MKIITNLKYVLWLTVLLGIGTAVHSEIPAGMRQSFNHTVQTGETWQSIAELHLRQPQSWDKLRVLNRYPHSRQPKSGDVVKIPVVMMLSTRAVSTVENVHGKVMVQTQTVWGKPDVGEELVPGGIITTGGDSFLTIRLADGSVVQVLANSQLKVPESSSIGTTGAINTHLFLKHGRLESKVIPTRAVKSSFEIRSPLAIAAVRGTHFGVSVDDASTSTSVDVEEGSVWLETTGFGSSLLTLNQGALIDKHGLTIKPLLGAPDLSDLPDLFPAGEPLELSLKPVQDAASYHAVLSNGSGISDPLTLRNSTDAKIRIKGPKDGVYYLRVRAVDSRGVMGRTSEKQIGFQTGLSKPLLLAPVRQSGPINGAYLFQCTERQSPGLYRIQISTHERFSTLVSEASGLDQCLYLTAHLDPGTYYWRAAFQKAQSNGDRLLTGPFSEAMRFDVGQISSNESARVGQIRFQVQVARDAAFADVISDEEVNSFAVTLHLAVGRYLVRWRRLYAEIGKADEFSAPQKLNVQHGS